MELKQLCNEVCNIARQAGSFIKENINKITHENIQKKGLHDFVTYVDLKSEEIIINGLLKLIPESGFIAEEKTRKNSHDRFNWIIDPLDGTTNYIHGVSPYSISIALMENQEIVLGVVYEISLDECFYAVKDDYAYLNGKRITVSGCKQLSEGLISTGFPYSNFSRLDPFVESLKYFMKNSHGVRRHGSAATDLAYVACGRFDAFYEYGLNPWDVAAGALIVKQAEGKVTDFSGNQNFLFGKEIIATNKNIFSEFIEVVKKFML
ncbi:MAG: inositol monophosphatase family protein [Marinilabiliales bacterium]